MLRTKDNEIKSNIESTHMKVTKTNTDLIKAQEKFEHETKLSSEKENFRQLSE